MGWVASNQKMGFEGKLLIGTSGSTATTPIVNVRDVTVSFDVEVGKTTVRGTGTAPPIETNDVTLRKLTGLEFEMINDVTDTALQTLLTQAYSGGRIAIRAKDYSSGKGPDADFNLKVEHGEPLNGEQTYKFTATPSRGDGRDPQLYV